MSFTTTSVQGSYPDDPDFVDDRELFETVGRVVACGATLEWTIVDLHETLLHSPRGVIVVAGEGFDRAKSGCMDLARVIGDPVDTVVKNAVTDAGHAWSRRNAVVHGSWLAGSHTGVPGRSGLTIRLRRSGLVTEGWSVESLSALLQDLSDAVDGINTVLARLKDAFDLGSLLDRPPTPWTFSPVSG